MRGQLRVIGFVFLGCATIFGDTAYAQQQQNQKRAAPPPRVVPGRPMIQRGQRVIGQHGVNGRPGGAVLARPGVIKGPAGALLKSKPARVVFNPKHKIGAAGARYNKQAFAFRRGGHFFRRHYYVADDGGVYFYDESMSPDDPMLSAPDALAGMPVCPADSDDCQGFNDSAGASQDDGAYAQALQFLVSSRPNVIWADGGLNITVDQDTGEAEFIPFQSWRVRFHRARLFGMDTGKDAITIVSPTNGEIDVLVDSYAQYKNLFDQILSALIIVGMRPMPLGADDIDITPIVARP